MGSATVQTQRGLQAERISALMDGEFDPDELAALLDEADTSGRPLWDDYHLIGDALRSDELTLPRSESAFMASFAARLDAEPHLLAPTALADAQAAAPGAKVAGSRVTRINPFLRVRRVLPTAAAAAAVAALSWVVVPRLQDHPAGGTQTQVLAQTAAPTSSGSSLTRVALSQQPQAAVAANGAGAGAPNDLIVLRDARLDQYLAAHQQYAPAPIGQSVSPYMRASAQADE
ncbi:anti-sigma factor [Pandoraea captiosa]|jgi:sigma-E factor negative regulatory protein RseA|uniref:Anti-sigma factor n=1 Tax=Pandoraea captiosa TaxID=2508302 RepID=A0A5E5A069_9BURK|nr:sigma-E factor negative regulatory protein [Pandoraea captiosa]VVE66666.1 anti-sigma factor [Pandoraea captiosa]